MGKSAEQGTIRAASLPAASRMATRIEVLCGDGGKRAWKVPSAVTAAGTPSTVTSDPGGASPRTSAQVEGSAGAGAAAAILSRSVR